MALKAAFIFLAPGANPAEHRSLVRTPEVELTTIGASSYEQAEKAVQSLLDQGIQAIELCGGFGTSGTARIATVVGSRAAVGAVRFDIHPGLGGKSGDQVFAQS